MQENKSFIKQTLQANPKRETKTRSVNRLRSGINWAGQRAKTRKPETRSKPEGTKTKYKVW